MFLALEVAGFKNPRISSFQYLKLKKEINDESGHICEYEEEYGKKTHLKTFLRRILFY